VGRLRGRVARSLLLVSLGLTLVPVLGLEAGWGAGQAAREIRASQQYRYPIRHVVIIVKENRSFDNLFGRFPGANGATTGVLSAAASRL